jgi:hypothetical protein
VLTEPLHRGNIFKRLMGHFDDVYEQLGLHMKRLAQMQTQVDELRLELKALEKHQP